MVRSTTSGVLKTYRYNLQRSTYTMNKARNTVLTGRNFNSFAEAPATAARAFQMRRAFQTANAQHSVGESIGHKYEQAWSTLDSVIENVSNRKSDSAYAEVIQGLSDPVGPGRPALGQSLRVLANEIVQSMNCSYAGTYVFAGTDGLNVPFTWSDTGELQYRGIGVDSGNIDTLNYMSAEVKYEDVGLGLQEDTDGNVIASSALNAALQGINYLGYGVDADGDPKNIVSIIARMSTLLSNCDSSSGKFASAADREEFTRLAEKFDKASNILSDRYIELDTQAAFLKSNQTQLENTAYTLQEQIVDLEEADPAEAITAFSWAEYCYNSALKVGNSILSESLMDYLKL